VTPENQSTRMDSIADILKRLSASSSTLPEPYQKDLSALIAALNTVLPGQQTGEAELVVEPEGTEAEIVQDLRDTRLLQELSARLVSEGDLQAFYDHILSAAMDLTHASGGTLQILDEDGQGLCLLAARGFDRALTDHFARVDARSPTSCGAALLTRRRMFLDFDVPASEDPDGSLRMHLAAGYRSAQSTPLVTQQGKLIGMFSTHWRSQYRPSERELRFLDLLARQASDLIEQKRAENALVKDAVDVHLHMRMVELSYEPVMVWDMERGIQAWNAGCEQLYGYRRSEALGRTIHELLHTRHPVSVEDFMDQLLANKHWEGELHHRTRDGREVVIESRQEVWELEGRRLVLETNRDITGRKRAETLLRESEERKAFLLGLSDALRLISDPVEMQGAAARVLGQYLGATRVFYGQVSEDGENLGVERNYVAEGSAVLTGTFRMADFGPALIAALVEGRTIALPDIASAPELSVPEREAFTALGIAAGVGVPLTKAGRFVAIINVHSSVARTWTQNEITLIEETAERTWNAVERARAEEALRASEEKYRTLFDTIDEGFARIEVLYDEAGKPVDMRWLEINRAFAQQTGLPGVTGKTFREVFPTFENGPIERCAQVVETGVPVRIERYVESLGGWFSIYAAPIPGKARNQVALVFTNITDRKRAEQALRESQDRLSALFEALPDGVGLLDLQGKLLFANPAMRRYLPSGVMPAVDEARYGRWRGYHPDGRRIERNEYPGVRALRGEKVLPGFDFLYIHDDGSEAWTRVAALPLRDSNGQVTGAVAIATDIDALKRAADELRASEERFRTSVESLDEAFVICSAVRVAGKIVDFRHEYVNDASCRLIGFSREQLLAHTMLALMPYHQESGLFQKYVQVVETGQPLSEEAYSFGEPADRQNNTLRILDLRAAPFRDGFILTGNDVTEQVSLEAERQEALQQQEIHRRLAEQREIERQSMARDLHDGPIQTLASLAFQLQFLKETYPDPALTVELEQARLTVKGAVQELREVMNELRPPSVIRFGLSRVIQNHAESMRERYPHIHWDLRLDDDELPLRLSEPVRLALFRIYQEAVNNIIKHSAANKVWVRYQESRHEVILEIRDNGRGFSNDYDLAELMHNRHFGLAGMSERAGAIGAALSVETKPGKGTTVRVAAPLPPLKGEGPSS
jgi:PAS domain S-box-containing protein